MALLDRIQRSTGIDGEDVPGHSFESALTLWFHGVITRPQIINKYSLPAGMEADLDKFMTKYDSFSPTGDGPLNQTRWVQDVVASVTALQIGEINKGNFNQLLGLDLTT